jgi:hypothetical protein
LGTFVRARVAYQRKDLDGAERLLRLSLGYFEGVARAIRSLHTYATISAGSSRNEAALQKVRS